MQHMVLNKTILELKNCQWENAKLNAELNVSNYVGNRLEMQCNNTLVANTKELVEAVQLKTSENENLMAELRTKNEEILA